MQRDSRRGKAVGRNWRGAAVACGEIGSTRLWLLNGDISLVLVDAVVATDDTTGWMKGEAAAAIKKAAGVEVEEQSIELGFRSPGEAWSTDPGEMDVKRIIHVAAMTPDDDTDDGVIDSAVTNALLLAESSGLESVAFPAIGTGVSGYPLARSAEIMRGAFGRHCQSGSEIKDLLVVLHSALALDVFLHEFAARRGARNGATTPG